MIISISHIEVGAVNGDSSGFIKTCCCAGAVCKSAGSWTCKRRYNSCRYNYLADLVIFNISHIEVGAVTGDSCWLPKTCCCAGAVCKSAGSWACKCCHNPARYNYLADPVIGHISHIEVGAVTGESYWLIKTCCCAGAVCKSAGSWACKRCHNPARYNYLADPVIVIISHIEVGAVTDDWSWIIKTCCCAGAVCKSTGSWACKGRYLWIVRQ